MVAEAAEDELDRFVAAVGKAMGRNIRGTVQQTEPASGQFNDFTIKYD